MRIITAPANRLTGLPLWMVSRARARHAAAGFSLLVPRPFVERIVPGDPCDPLLRQVLPRPEESVDVAGFEPDPLGEVASARPGVLIGKKGTKVDEFRQALEKLTKKPVRMKIIEIHRLFRKGIVHNSTPLLPGEAGHVLKP